MKFSIRINNDLSIPELLDLAIAADEVGIDQVWVSNDLMLRSAAVLMGALATHTHRVHLGTGIFNPYTVHPTEIAMIAATAQEVSGGRFLLGIGAGAEEFLRWAGLERTKPLTTTRQAVAALRRMLGHQDVKDSDLPPWWSDEARLRIPLLAPVPVYVGAMGPRMRQMAGEVADGALPLLFPPESFGAARADIQAGRKAACRTGSNFDLPACVWVSLGEKAEAQKALAKKLAYFGSSLSPIQLESVGATPASLEPAARLAFLGEMDAAASLINEKVLSLGISGSVDDVVQRCAALALMGAEHISFGPPLGPDPVTAVRLLGSEVLPALRRLASHSSPVVGNVLEE